MIAITFGRYNIVTNAHMNTIETILKQWSKVVVGIVLPQINEDFDINPKWQRFYQEGDKKNSGTPEFSISERISMWNLSLEEKKLNSRVKVVPILRPEYYPEIFNATYPEREYQLVFPCDVAVENSFDNIRNAAFENILNRKVQIIYPQLILHTTDIRRNVRVFEDWKEYVPSGSYKIIKEKKCRTCE